MHEVVARELEAATRGAAIGLHALEARERAIGADVEARRAVAVPEHAREIDAACRIRARAGRPRRAAPSRASRSGSRDGRRRSSRWRAAARARRRWERGRRGIRAPRAPSRAARRSPAARRSARAAPARGTAPPPPRARAHSARRRGSSRSGVDEQRIGDPRRDRRRNRDHDRIARERAPVGRRRAEAAARRRLDPIDAAIASPRVSAEAARSSRSPSAPWSTPVRPRPCAR